MTLRRLALGTALLLGEAPALAQDYAAFYESCFARDYDAAHLAAHAGQDVTAVTAEIIEWETNPFVRVGLTLRSGERYSLGGDCYDPIEGGVLCHLCRDESCESGEETFKVMLKSADRITIVNDTTGVTGRASDEDGGGSRLIAAGGEHGAFALTRADAARCE
jgi:hypothetical protein